MKAKFLIKTFFALLIVSVVTSCSGYDVEVIEDLNVSREFAPIDLVARVRNQTNVELNWAAKDNNVTRFVVEFSADDSSFSSIFLSQEVKTSELPVTLRLEGETLYSIRVKSISDRGLEDSSWALATAQTLTEQIMLPSEPGDIKAIEATLRWEAGLNVTHFIIQPGDLRYDLNAAEKAAGVATISGLTSESDLMATLYNNTKIRGSIEFTTGIDVGDGILVFPTDDLFQVIADAQAGDVILLEQGDYTAQVGTITLDKSITIRGLRTDFKPLVKLGFSIADGATDVELIDLDISGDAAAGLIDVVSYSAVGNFNSMLISGCNIHDFDRSFVRGSTDGSILQSLTIENSILTNIITNGGDFVDFRNSDVLGVNLLNSTFNNCAPGRDFLRLDNAGLSNGNANVDILIDSCTIHACSNNSSRRLLYVRFATNEVVVRNTLISDTASEGYADRSGIDETPVFSNNNYFNAAGFYNTAQYTFDGGVFTTEDPGYVDPAAGNFTLTNQNLIDNAVGDPRWRN